MPELPEVETVVRELRGHLPGRRILRASLTAPDLYRRGSAKVAVLGGALIESVTRRGKAIVVVLQPGEGSADRLVVHLGMTGRLEWNETAPSPASAKAKHLHARWQFADGSELRYFDPRRFGFVFVGTAAAVDGTLRIGPDPFELDADALAERLAGRRAPVKSLLLDQHLVSGLGNIYVDEALHRAHIHPLVSGDRASKQAAAILEAARYTLARAIDARGTTLRDYRRTDGATGEFQFELSVYGRDGEKCTRCGSRIRRIVVSQRGTHFCPRCQRAPRVSATSSGRSRADRSHRAGPRPAGYTRSR
jgi:formamidopyrimidine-DNA glycosylase